MSKIQELYKKAEVQPVGIAELGATYYALDYMTIDDKLYPVFNDTKQLSLIKLLLPRCLEILNYEDDDKKIKYKVRTNLGAYAHAKSDDFAELIAELILDLWQELNIIELTQIRTILND